MWFLLILICVSTVGGVPMNPPLNATVAPQGVNVTIELRPPQNSSNNAETLEELQSDAFVQEGDILMSDIQEDRNAVQELWFTSIIPYEIMRELADRESDILAAFKMISDVTCISFKKRTTESNYIIFKEGQGCASFVGCRGGAQPIFFSRKCSVGNLCHEIIHALGLHHEHTRKDRDKYVEVKTQNIISGKENNFEMKQGKTLDVSYDVYSIMHYGPLFFSKNGNPTLVSKHSGNEVDEMGQRKHLTELDIKRLNKLYHCSK